MSIEAMRKALDVLVHVTTLSSKKARDDHAKAVSGLREAIAAAEKAEPVFDEGDALTVAYLHGHDKGKDSVQPLLAEKDALLRQALEALELPCDRWNAVQYKIVSAAINAIRNHFEVET